MRGRLPSELRRTAADRGVRVRVTIAGTRTAARLLVRHRAGLTVIEPGTEAMALASLPIVCSLTFNQMPRRLAEALMNLTARRRRN